MIEHSRPTIGKEERRALIEVLKSNYLAEGTIVSKFEREMAGYIGGKGAVATSTGTLALHLALLSLDVGEGDEVIVPSYVCRSALNAILYCKGTPVISDVNKEDYNISFTSARRLVTKKTKAVIVPHMFGCPAEIDKFMDLGVRIIEDCAHSVGAEYKNKKIGSWGDLSIFSFEGTKYIVTGEGGMVLTKSATLLKKLRCLKEPDSFAYGTKYTYRMTNMQAALGRSQLARIDLFIRKRRKIAERYGKCFSALDIDLPKEEGRSLHVFHRYMITIKGDAKAFMGRCLRRGLKVKQPVKPFPLHTYMGFSDDRYPNTASIMQKAVSIPLYPSLSGKEIAFITATVKSEITRQANAKSRAQ